MPQANAHIDRLRGLLALGVMLGHAIAVASLVAVPAGRLHDMIAPWQGLLGFDCVVGFIVVSGYCIARSTKRASSAFSLRRFALQRATRIFPLLFVVTAFAFVVEFITAGPDRPAIWETGIDGEHFVATALGLAGIFGQYGSLAPSYTISYELIYYSLWGVAVAVIGARRPGLILIACAIVGVVLCLTAQWLLSIGVERPLRLFCQDFAFLLFGPWLIGAGVALFEDRLAPLVRRVPIWVIACAIIWFLIVALDFGKPRLLAEPSDAAFYIAFSVLLGLLLARLVSAPASHDNWLGALSYPLFLVHGPALIAIGFAINLLSFPLGFGAALLVLAGGAILLALALVWSVELPVMAWRRKAATAVTQRF